MKTWLVSCLFPLLSSLILPTSIPTPERRPNIRHPHSHPQMKRQEGAASVLNDPRHCRNLCHMSPSCWDFPMSTLGSPNVDIQIQFKRTSLWGCKELAKPKTLPQKCSSPIHQNPQYTCKNFYLKNAHIPVKMQAFLRRVNAKENLKQVTVQLGH